VRALREHGVCIIPSFFPTAVVAEGGRRAVEDVQCAIQRLEGETIGMKLMPSPSRDVDYEEYARRDVQFVRGHGDKYTLKRGAQLEEYTKLHSERLRHNPSLLAVMEQLVLPFSGADGSNIGLGKTAEFAEERKHTTMLRRSSSLLESQELGAVVALPGDGRTKDQMIHVDTEHLYEHLHLPPHYVVMFLPSLSTESELKDEVGQTAFVVGTHMSTIAKEMCFDGKVELQSKRWELESVIRPHCEAGDVVLFDARILHFGIANSSSEVWRPLLFVNYTRPWFSDFQPGGEIIVRHR
jgi:hypothetical protein